MHSGLFCSILGKIFEEVISVEGMRFIRPTEEYLDQVWAYKQEMAAADSSMDGTGPLRRVESAEEWLKYSRTCETIEKSEKLVPATQFILVRESDNKLVGMLQVRHCFNAYLEKYAGHIGYSVRPDERRKGYAKAMLKEALKFCREELGLEKVLITCLTENEGSRRTILSCGGVYEYTIHEPDDNEDLERYWVSTKE